MRFLIPVKREKPTVLSAESLEIVYELNLHSSLRRTRAFIIRNGMKDIVHFHDEEHLRLDATSVEQLEAAIFKDFEIIVINDGSADDTHKILLPYVESRKIRYYYQENAGLSSARNAGIRRSQGNFIALLDADDSWESDKLHLQYNLINASPHIGMVFTDFNTFSGQTILTRDKNAVKFTHHTPVLFQELFDNLNFIYPSSFLPQYRIGQESNISNSHNASLLFLPVILAILP